MPDAPTFSAALLAGGKSTRMGRDKALLTLPGTSEILWQHQLRTLEGLQPEEIFWSGSPRPGLPENIRVVSDAVENAGPLAGLGACLEACRSDLLVVLAIDLPMIGTADFFVFLTRASKTQGLVGKNGDFFEPLAAVYPKAMLDVATEHLRAGRFALQDFVREGIRRRLLHTLDLTEGEKLMFKNVNSPADL